jgi:hypothetical protein
MMGFTPTFYAGRPKLSEVTIDSDLDMGGRNILRARIGSPYVPETWPTEELDWGDVPTSPAAHIDTSVTIPRNMSDITVMSWTTPAGDSYRWTLNLVLSGERVTVTIKANGEVTDTFLQERNTTVNKILILPPSAAVTVTASNSTLGDSTFLNTSYYQCTGTVVGPKTFNLTGKWLALGVDMKGLAATVKIQGVEMPYSDYALYFPIAPTELTIPGDWDVSQERPVIEVYK